MNIVLFIHQDSSENGARLKEIIENKFRNTALQTIHTFNAFKERLKAVPDYDKEIFILLADSKHRLNDLIVLADLLDDKRILLILPDDSQATLQEAHRLFPRFLTSMSSTYEDVCSVLTKMIRQGKNKSVKTEE